jgi:predicted nuclease of predicted toxin-antitoxin system
MNFSILVDMNLSPDWITLLQQHGHTSVHWRTVGNVAALDSEIMDWARLNNHIVLTHDLDFGTLLAQTHATGPSVVLVRGEDILPTAIGNVVVTALQQCGSDLQSGAIVVLDTVRTRVRILPI